MSEAHEYRVTLEGTDVKSGVLNSPDGLPTVNVASPPQFGGPERVWSPEHLFVAAVASCLMTTFRAVSTMSKLEIAGYSDDASGELIRDSDGRYRIESVTLRPRVVITDPEKVDKALRLIEKAEGACLVSRSIDAEVRMIPEVVVSELAA